MKKVTITVPVERGGKTHMVPQEIEVPRDWDAIALGAVRVTTSLAVAGAVTWSTVAIGGFLSAMAPVWTAYLVAGFFDLAWITCMALEWLSRYDRDRAKLPIRAGWVALAISVTLIALEGHKNGSLIVGVCGGAVSALAKGMWAVSMRHSAVEMDPVSQGWLDAERREINSRLAVMAARRGLTRTEYRTSAEALALSAGQPETWTATPVQDSPVSVPVLDSPVETVPVPVRVSSDKGQDSLQVQRDRTSDLSGRISHRAFVRGLLSADPSLSDTDLSESVRTEYGQDTKPDSIRKAIQRARGDLSQTA